MSIEIPADYSSFIQGAIAQGTYENEAEVVTAALALLRDRQRVLEQVRSELQPSLQRLDRGEGLELDDAELDQLCEDIIRRKGPHSNPSSNQA